MRGHIKKFAALTWFVALFAVALIKAQGCRATSSPPATSDTPQRVETLRDAGASQQDSGEEDMGAAQQQDAGGEFDEPPGLIPATKSGPVMQRDQL